MCNYKNYLCRGLEACYLERTKRHLLLYTEIADFFMVHQIKIYILSNLFLQIIITGYLDLFAIARSLMLKKINSISDYEINRKET